MNCPFAAKVNHPQSRDGLMRTDYNGEGEPTIYPNSRNGTPTQSCFGLYPPVYTSLSLFSNRFDDQLVGPRGDAKYNWKPVPVTGVIDRASSSRHAGTDSEYDQVRVTYVNCSCARVFPWVTHLFCFANNVNDQGT